jgi:hypothetical protein
LTVGLVIAALALLGGLGVHAWWSARRARPVTAERAFLSGDERREPALDGAAGMAEGHAESEGEPIDPLPLPALQRRAGRLDALIDAIVPLPLDQPVAGELAVAHLPSSWRAGSKPIHVEGLNAATGEWEVPRHGVRYEEFQAGVQLTNRSGALNEIEYSEFVQKTQAFAEGVGAMADFPDMLEVIARARELDAFATPLDAQLAITLRASGVAWSVGYVTQCAARQGFVGGAMPGRLVVPGAEEGAPAVLVLSFDPQAALAEEGHTAVVREVSLSLDVPQTEEAAEPFPAWHRTATALAAEMHASVEDSQGAPVTLQAYATIGRELTQLYRSLESRDLAAGSAAARRLFSG